jgi:hypothetical protein
MAARAASRNQRGSVGVGLEQAAQQCFASSWARWEEAARRNQKQTALVPKGPREPRPAAAVRKTEVAQPGELRQARSAWPTREAQVAPGRTPLQAPRGQIRTASSGVRPAVEEPQDLAASAPLRQSRRASPTAGFGTSGIAHERPSGSRTCRQSRTPLSIFGKRCACQCLK